jgi:hypothetical protein
MDRNLEQPILVVVVGRVFIKALQDRMEKALTVGPELLRCVGSLQPRQFLQDLHLTLLLPEWWKHLQFRVHQFLH